MRNNKIKYVIGVDEAGRGPLAGPVAVGAVLLTRDFLNMDRSLRCESLKELCEVRDPKTVTSKRRSEWFEVIKEKKKHGVVDYAVSLVGPTVIDKYGIVKAIRLALRRSLLKLAVDKKESLIILDGLLKAPRTFPLQATIIRGDQTEQLISLAALVAKASRDEKMCRLAERYPVYGFERHKGYGTKEHYERIRNYGLCRIHRKSFLKSFYGGVFAG
jgi:ribonuclease HII